MEAAVKASQCFGKLQLTFDYGCNDSGQWDPIAVRRRHKVKVQRQQLQKVQNTVLKIEAKIRPKNTGQAQRGRVHEKKSKIKYRSSQRQVFLSIALMKFEKSSAYHRRSHFRSRSTVATQRNERCLKANKNA